MINNKIIFVPLLLLMTYKECETSLATQFKLIKGNARKYIVEDVKREQDLEYPRKDRKILAILQTMWEKYYTCLKEKQNENRKPEIRRLIEGQYTEFQCDICQRPFQNYEEIQWKYKPLEASEDITEPQYLDLTSEMMLTENKTLKIFNAMEPLAGLYVCYQHRNVISVYILEVSKNDTIEKVETTQIHGKQLVRLEGNSYQVTYQWTTWTECSTCGKVGRKFKYGTCAVSPLYQAVTNEKPHNRTHRSQKTVPTGSTNDMKNSEEVKHFKTLNQNPLKNLKLKTLFEDDNSTLDNNENQNWPAEIIEKFSNGVPCASKYLPVSTFEFLPIPTSVKVLVQYCWEPCQENEIFEVLDNLGRVVEMANNTAGIYSVFQKIPQLPPDIERRSIAGEFGKDITIQCPGTSRTNTPIIWKVNKKIIFPEVVANESRGRIQIDLVQRLHIKKLRLKDSKIFSCWQKNRLVGTVHLNVDKKFKVGFNHHITLVGIIAVVGTFLFVGSKMLARELKYRKK